MPFTTEEQAVMLEAVEKRILKDPDTASASVLASSASKAADVSWKQARSWISDMVTKHVLEYHEGNHPVFRMVCIKGAKWHEQWCRTHMRWHLDKPFK